MTKEALKLALEALNDLAVWHDGEVGGHMDEPYAAEVARRTITAIKEALAQPEQEPVGRFAKFTDGIWREVTDGSAGVPLYLTPPQRTWVGLTEDEAIELLPEGDWEIESTLDFARAIETKLRSKNT